MTTSTESILGYEIEVRSDSGCIEDIVNWIGNGDYCKWLACINPHSYIVASGMDSFKKALRSADWLIPDGIGIVFASFLLRGKIRRRITGSDIFRNVMKHCQTNRPQTTVFFLGATTKTLNEIKARVAVDFPHVNVVGVYSPPFKAEYSASEINEMVTAINSVSPDILWVGMTSPKQDLWIQATKARLNVKFAAGIGAVFDFYAGNVKRSPILFQSLGLEWLIRLLQEPRRLARRYVVNSPLFMADVFRELIFRGR